MEIQLFFSPFLLGSNRLCGDRVKKLIKETEEYYPRLLKVIKAEADFNNAAWLLNYHMESMLDIYKRLL